MKLPQYDNRPPHTPLYSSNDDSPFETIKFLLLAIGLPVALVACVALVVWDLFLR